MTSDHEWPETDARDGDVFRTDRLVVRHWRTSDVSDLLKVYGMKDVIRWVDDGQPLSAEEAAQWINITLSNYETRGYGMFVIEDPALRKTIGFGGLVHPGGQQEPEVKYAFIPEVWGQGLATEFVRGLLDYGKSAHGLTHVISTVSEGNLASKRVLSKTGLHRSAVRREEDGSQTEIYELRL